ncbi:D-ribose pyranase [Brevibacillus fluminis]|uniref:D-ribose pyranase n=1 Tax=Brevibacillus fluminis TaxID=511487 RepID=UPI003F8B9685
MKKIGILNSDISSVISQLGHTDKIVICDSGLPIPDHVKRIDLALTKGIPSFMDTLAAVLLEMQVEHAIIASEMEEKSPGLKQQVEQLLAETTITQVSHEAFKQLTKEAKAIIRTGEFTPYANVILQAGVVF